MCKDPDYRPGTNYIDKNERLIKTYRRQPAVACRQSTVVRASTVGDINYMDNLIRVIQVQRYALPSVFQVVEYITKISEL